MRISRLGLSFASAAVVASVAFSAPAFAAPPLQPDLSNDSLSYVANPLVTGTVPSGVCGALFNVRGGSGGGATLMTMSPGGEVTGTLVLTAGQVIQLHAGSSADSYNGGIGGYAPGGAGYVGGGALNYGGGAASSLSIQGVGLIVVAGGGGGTGDLGHLGGAGGGGTSGAGADGSNSGGLGGSIIASGTSAGGVGIIPGSAGGGGGYSGGGVSLTPGYAGGGGSNYFRNGYANATMGSNGAYSGAAGGFSGVTYQPCLAPSAPASLTVTPNGTSASLSFPRSVDNGSPVTGYQYSIDGGQNWNTLTTTGTTTKTATISALTVGAAYTLTVRPTYLTAAINMNQGGGLVDFGGQVSANFSAAAGAPSVTSTGSATLSATGADGRGLLATGLALALTGVSALLISLRRTRRS